MTKDPAIIKSHERWIHLDLGTAMDGVTVDVDPPPIELHEGWQHLGSTYIIRGPSSIWVLFGLEPPILETYQEWVRCSWGSIRVGCDVRITNMMKCQTPWPPFKGNPGVDDLPDDSYCMDCT
eukprot:1344744-Pyramimonas_sp.AAC.1